MLKKVNINNEIMILIFLMFVFSPLLVFQIKGKDFFLLFQILFIFVMFIKYKRITLICDSLILLLFLGLFVNAFSAMLTDMPIRYKKTAIYLAIVSVPLYLALCYIKEYIKSDKKSVLNSIFKAFKVALIVQLVWIPLQLLLYRGFHFDINKFIFVDKLHFVANASFIRSWKWYPSGMNWHSAALAPLFVLGIIVYKNPIIRIVIFAEALLVGNSTTLLGVGFCMLCLALRKVVKGKSSINKNILYIVSLSVILVFLGVILLKQYDKIISVFTNIWNRFFGSDKDASTEAHMGYYLDYIQIFKDSSWVQRLFGYGYGCSGYPISVMHNRYLDGTSTWSIESDIVNIIVSRGLVGFSIYYYFLGFIAVKGSKIDFRYAVFMITVFLQGFGYNIQFDYLFAIELILYLTIKMKINLFEIITDKVSSGGE